MMFSQNRSTKLSATFQEYLNYCFTHYSQDSTKTAQLPTIKNECFFYTDSPWSIMILVLLS